MAVWNQTGEEGEGRLQRRHGVLLQKDQTNLQIHEDEFRHRDTIVCRRQPVLRHNLEPPACFGRLRHQSGKNLCKYSEIVH